MSLENKKVIVITGASTGVGRELAILYGKRGYKVGLLARRLELMEEVRDGIVAANGISSIAECDVTDREGVNVAIKKIVGTLGDIDILVANAGIKDGTWASKVNSVQASKIFQVNVFGVLNCIEAVLPGMLKRNSGHIVGISSLGAYLPVPQDPVYCASKAALSSLLEGFRLELFPKNIFVTTICPGFIKTPMISSDVTPQPLLMGCEKAAYLIMNAIEKKKKVYSFPSRLYILTLICKILPKRLLSKIMCSM